MINLLLVAVLVLAVGPQESGSRVFERGKHQFSITPPQGWNWDEQAYSKASRRVLLRPARRDSPGIDRSLSVEIIVKPDKRRGGFTRIVDEHVGSLRQEFDRLKVSTLTMIRVMPGKVAVVKQLVQRNTNLFMAIAYIDEPEYVGVVILRSNSESTYNASTEAFEAAVRSFRVAHGGKIDDAP